MSSRKWRIALASVTVVLSAACNNTLGPSAAAEAESVETTPMAGEHQGSDSIRAADTPTLNTEHQGSDS